MNALQQLIDDYLAENRSESYASIGRRGSTDIHRLPRSTVHSMATKSSWRQTPQASTLTALARGMNMSEDKVRTAAADAAGYKAGVSSVPFDSRTQIILEAMNHLDPERMEVLARRARFLLAEMREEQQAKN